MLADSARRCKECKRLIRGHAGNACPFCGSDRLVPVLLQNVSEIRRHSSVLTAAITFCLGLTLIRIVIAFAGQRLSYSFAMTGELVGHLHMLSTACTVLYLILRHYEGDFRALFTVSLGLFVLSEGIAAIASRFGMMPLESLSSLFNITLFMYSSLAVTAGIADGPQPERYHRPLGVACLGFVLLSCMRVFFHMRGGSDRSLNFAAAIILLLITAVVGLLIVRAESQGQASVAAGDSSSIAAVGSSAPPPPSAASTPAAEGQAGQ